MIDQIVEILDKKGIEDYEVEERIPKDVISVTCDELGNVKVYLPKDFEYSQYDIDDYIRSLYPHYRTTTTLDLGLRIYIMKVSGSMKAKDIAMLIGYIANENEFCSIIQ